MIGVGDEITRDDGTRFRLCGISSDGEWVAENLEEFSPPVTLSARDLASCGVEAGESNPSNPSDPVATETRGWQALAEAAEADRLREPQEAPTVEEFFAAVAIEEEQERASDGPSERPSDTLDGADAKRLGHKG